MNTGPAGDSRRASAELVRKGTAKPIGVDPTTCDRLYDAAETEFLAAVAAYQKRHRRKFPTACEYLRVLLALGYRKGDDA